MGSCKNLCRHFTVSQKVQKGELYHESIRYCTGCGDPNKYGILVNADMIAKIMPHWNRKTCPCCGQTLRFSMKVLAR